VSTPNPSDHGSVPDSGASVEPTVEVDRGQLIGVLLLLGVNGILLIWGVPKFKGALDALKEVPPYATQVILGLSNFLANYWLIVVGLLITPVWLVLRHPARVPAAINRVLLVVLAGGIVVIPVTIFYPILKLFVTVHR
jgi:glucan phosphoethanolaminetransferase (alkaline phosphatase superfamily)